MMGVRTPETLWTVHKRQVINLGKLLHIVVWFIGIVLWCTDMQTLNFEYSHLFPACGTVAQVRSNGRTAAQTARLHSVYPPQFQSGICRTAHSAMKAKFLYWLTFSFRMTVQRQAGIWTSVRLQLRKFP
jgi:hypothetical protein